MNDSIGKIIKKLRKENNLTQNDIAKKYNVSFQAVSKWENGKSIPDIETLKKICSDFNISMDDILGSNTKKKTKKYLLIIIPIIVLLITIGILIFKNDTFEFKKLSTSCKEFNITGSISYNSNKTAIYISDIEYCKEDNEIYKNIKCTLYEKNENIEAKISEEEYNGAGIKLKDYLNELSFQVENYNRICKDYSKDSLFIRIETTNNKNETTNYKVAIKLNSCTK